MKDKENTSNKDEIRNQPNYVKLLGVDEAQKKLNEQKDFFNEKLKSIDFDKTIFAEISNYIFEREF